MVAPALSKLFQRQIVIGIGSTTRAVLIATPPRELQGQKVVPNQTFQSGANIGFKTFPSRVKSGYSLGI